MASQQQQLRYSSTSSQSRRLNRLTRGTRVYSTKSRPVESHTVSKAIRTSHDQTPEAPPLSHLTATGEVHMISIAGKIPSSRSATAVATLLFSTPTTYSALTAANNKKGDAVAVARIAAIQAAKKTSELIPLAHPGLSITGVTVDIQTFTNQEKTVRYITHDVSWGGDDASTLEAAFGGAEVRATVSCEGKTGVEMEAITAATMGAITLYDMLKGVDKGMSIMGCRVLGKEGGKSGGWIWDERENKLMRMDDKT